MNRYPRVMILILCVVPAALTTGWLYRSQAQEKTPAAQGADQQQTPELAAARGMVQKLADAFNKGDAVAVAAFWTEEGEFIGPDAEAVRGRAAIEKAYGAFFAANPKATLNIKVDSARRLSKHTAVQEGTLELKLTEDARPVESRYSALHVLEDNGWKLASVREWIPDPALDVTVKDLSWLAGEWVAKTEDTEIHTHFDWVKGQAFLRGDYKVSHDGKETRSGMQVIGTDPAGGLRSWTFESTGAYGSSFWSRDERRWVIESESTLPDGNTQTSTNVLVPVDDNTFNWLSTDRAAGGAELPNIPPIRVTRVKAGK